MYKSVFEVVKNCLTLLHCSNKQQTKTTFHHRYLKGMVVEREAMQRRPKEVRECDKGCKEDIVCCSPEWGGGSQKRPPKRPEETIGDQGKPENARSENTREC